MYSFHHTILRDEGPLRRQRWRFTLIEHVLHLDEWAIEIRQTPRHRRWETLESYVRLHGTRNEPDIPAEIVEEALEVARGRMTFRKWRDR